jgi:hypothetical protein
VDQEFVRNFLVDQEFGRNLGLLRLQLRRHMGLSHLKIAGARGSTPRFFMGLVALSVPYCVTFLLGHWEVLTTWGLIQRRVHPGFGSLMPPFLTV